MTRKLGGVAGLVAIASLSGCYRPEEWNPGLATPTATQLHYARDAARFRPAEAAAIVAAGAGLQAAGYDPDKLLSRKPTSAVQNPTAPVRGVETPSAARGDVDPDAAVRACTLLAESEGRRAFALSRVTQIRSTDPLGDGLMIRGDVLLRASDKEEGEARPFRCRVDAQAVRMVAIDGIQTLPPR